MIRHNMVDAIGWQRIVLAGVPGEPSLAGLDIERAAAQAGMEAVEFLCALLHRTKGTALIALNSMDWEDVKRIAHLPYSLLISDALYNEGATHPRRFGAFPRFLRQFVREEKVLSMGEAVRKMTRLPAERLGLCDRGLLMPGLRADVNVFDPGEVTDRATFGKPDMLSEGIRHTFVGGHRAGKQASGEILKA
jgi:N-acyl-D-amino-acid deacylase